MSERCDTCRFYGGPEYKGAEYGRCQRHPPHVVTVPEWDDDGRELTGAWKAVTRWPIVENDDWCGEHQQIGS